MNRLPLLGATALGLALAGFVWPDADRLSTAPTTVRTVGSVTAPAPGHLPGRVVCFAIVDGVRACPD